MEKNLVQSSPYIKNLILAGEPQKLEVQFLGNLEKVDIRALNLVNMYSASMRFNSKTFNICCTETQVQFSEALRKIKVKKDIQASTSEEIDFYAKWYNWDMGTKFLLWVVKHPLCDKGTALSIYWEGHPEFDTSFKTAKEVPGIRMDVYKLLKTIEKNIRNNFYQNARIAFDPAIFYEDNNFQYPENPVNPIPVYMFEKVTGI